MNSLLATLFSGILYLFCWPSEKDRLNAQMAELCAQDGGVKVYETVQLSSDAYSDAGVLKESGYKKIGRNESVVILAGIYKWHMVSDEIKQGEPFKGQGHLARNYSRIERTTDGKILAEAIYYSRGGGDRWFAGMPSSSNCLELDGIKLVDKVFLRANQ